MLDATEQGALASGEPIIRIEHDVAHGEHLRVVVPSRASKNYLGKDITHKSSSLQQSIRRGMDHLHLSRSAAQVVSGAFREANASVTEVGEGLDRIVMASEAQRRSSETVTANIEAIADMAQANNVAIERTVKAARELETLAAQLQESVSRLRV